MKTTITYNSLLIYSEENSKYFYTDFGSGVNIIYGRNTSGKSTVIKSLIYTLGINDGKSQLSDLLSENVLFRLDCTLVKGDSSEKISFIRDNDFLIVKR